LKTKSIQPGLKIAVIGGGSTYTPELVSGFLSSFDSLPLAELWLEDIDSQRLQIVGGFARRMVAAQGQPFKVILSTDQRESITGSSYVITQLRVGKMPARRGDEYFGKRHGLIGQETTGVGGMANALRTIPVILDLARDIRESAPQALLLNFANPSGLITEALSRYAPEVQSVGVCNVSITTTMVMVSKLAEFLGQAINPEHVQLDTLGLNHLTWHRGFLVEGKDLWSQLFPAYLEQLRLEENPEWDPAALEVLGMLPNDYLQYFYSTEKKLQEQQHWPPSRAEQVMQIEQDLLHQYADPGVVNPPPDLMLRGGAFYSTLATRIIRSHYNDLGETHIVNLPHRGAVAGWIADWVLEIPAAVHRSGITPLPAKPLPPVCFDLLSRVKSFELLAVEAAVHGDRNAARQALLAHPLGPSAGQVDDVLLDMLQTNQEWLPQFDKLDGKG
jgi:6-phospho-beta-glucosidase